MFIVILLGLDEVTREKEKFRCLVATNYSKGIVGLWEEDPELNNIVIREDFLRCKYEVKEYMV